jgi:hypothetical protein
LLAPEFSEKDYPGDAYAFGNMLVRKRLELTVDTYDILGHSASPLLT